MANDLVTQPDDDTPRDEGDALCKKLGKWITDTYDSEENKAWRDRIKTNRRYNKGFSAKDGEGWDIANLIYSTIQSIVPRVYAKNPEIAISPTETIGEQRPKWIKPFCQTLTIVLNKQFEGADLKRRGKAAARSTMVTALAWLKVSYQRDIREDAEIFNRISDSQDNLQRVEHLIAKIENDDESYDELQAEKLELKQQIAALNEKAEVVVAEGLVIDRLRPEDVLVDLDIDDPDCYTQAPRIAHRVWYTCDKFEQKFKRKPAKKANRYTRDGKDKDTQSAGKKSDDDRVAVWEIQDKESQTVYNVCEGDPNWAREPYRPKLIGERFYSLFLLFFNPVDGEFYPMSDVELLQNAVKEYNETRMQLQEHRKLNKPKYLADAETDMKTLRRYEDAELGEIILVDANGRPIQEVIQPAKPIPINPGVYDTSPIRADIEYLSGAGDAGRGSVQKAKTATEAEILSETLASRTSERQDVIEDLIRDIAVFTAELLLQELEEPQVKRIAGENAVWPSLTKEQIFDLVQIEVRAGTSGKPNRIQEQETWLKFMPLLRESVIQISELREQGREEEAETLIAITKETFRRFDERLDVEEFIPVRDEDDPEVALGQAMQKIKQLEGMLMQAQEQMQGLQKQAAQEIDKARNANSQDVQRKLFELEKMKIQQYDTFNQLIADLQTNYQSGVAELMQAMAANNQPPAQSFEQAPALPPVINVNVDVDAKDGAKTIDVTERDADGQIRQLMTTPAEGNA